MSKNSSSSTRRGVLASAAVARAFGLLVEQTSQAGTALPTPEGPGSATGAPHLPKEWLPRTNVPPSAHG